MKLLKFLNDNRFFLISVLVYFFIIYLIERVVYNKLCEVVRR